MKAACGFCSPKGAYRDVLRTFDVDKSAPNQNVIETERIAATEVL
ncbi:hypothetical protein FB009_1502 [Sinorhizobium medicae]|nr:hypothetical protein FB009_1502 [Sinorhizobium medicae]